MRILLTALLSIVLSTTGLALNISDYRFHTMPETSYYGGIHSIAKDSVGRIWFSGYDALFVYNGNSFVQMNDFVTSLLPASYWSYGQVITDKAKRLYVGTNQGLLRFNYQTKGFECLLKGNIGSIACGDDGTLWFIRDGRLESFHPNQWPTVTHYPLPQGIQTPALALICVNEHIYIASNGKVYRLNKSSKQYQLFCTLGDDGCVIKDVITHHGTVYILTLTDGLYQCDDQGRVRKHYNLAREYGKPASTKKLYLDSSNTLWVAT